MLIGIIPGIASAAGPATFRGQPMQHWVDALDDLDPRYRKEAVRALAHFGKEAIKPLVRALKDRDSAIVAAAAGALVEMGTDGRAAFEEVLITPSPDVQVAVLNVIPELGASASYFIPHLRTLAAAPRTSLPAMAALARIAQSTDASALGGPDQPPSRPDTRLRSPARWERHGLTLEIVPVTCLVEGLFPRFDVWVGPPPSIDEGKLYFRSTVSGGSTISAEWFYVELTRNAPEDRPDALAYMAWLPRPGSGTEMAAVHYFVHVRRRQAEVRSAELGTALQRSAEDCVSAGLTPAATRPPDSGQVTVFSAGESGGLFRRPKPFATPPPP